MESLRLALKELKAKRESGPGLYNPEIRRIMGRIDLEAQKHLQEYYERKTFEEVIDLFCSVLGEGES